MEQIETISNSLKTLSYYIVFDSTSIPFVQYKQIEKELKVTLGEFSQN